MSCTSSITSFRSDSTRRRQPDGAAYEQTVQRGGTVQPVALPGVNVDVERLFD